MSVRAKFKCVSKDDQQAGVKLEVVIDGSEENESFFQYTPAGFVQIAVLNENAFSQFQVGKEYYVDFSVAE